MNYRNLTTEERESMVSLLKGTWFYLATLCSVHRSGIADVQFHKKEAEKVGEQLDKYLKEL